MHLARLRNRPSCYHGGTGSDRVERSFVWSAVAAMKHARVLWGRRARPLAARIPVVGSARAKTLGEAAKSNREECSASGDEFCEDAMKMSDADLAERLSVLSKPATVDPAVDDV